MQLLKVIGFSVRGAASGEEALRLCEEQYPDLVLMDVHMPGIGGLEATRRLKAEPSGAGIVVIVLTASALDEDKRTAIQSGADGFVAKPCHEDELLETIRLRLSLDYDYEDAELPADPETPDAPALNPAKLALLEAGLFGDIRNAVFTGNKKMLNLSIQRVHETGDTQSASALQQLADTYEYDSLMRSLEAACAS